MFTEARTLASLGQPLFKGLRAEVYAWEPGKVVKLYLPGWDRETLEGEANATQRVYEAGIPAPACYGTVVVGGRLGIILEWVDGPSLGDIILASEFSLERSGELGAILGELHAKVHSVVTTEPPPFRPALERRIRRAPVLSPELKDAVLRLLATLPEAQSGGSLLHGDFHPSNVLMSSRGPLVIDWDSVHWGNPLADVGRTLLILRAAAVLLFKGPVGTARVSNFTDAYLRRYFELRPGTPAEAEAWLVPLAAARLTERVPGEEEWLVDLVRTGVV